MKLLSYAVTSLRCAYRTVTRVVLKPLAKCKKQALKQDRTVTRVVLKLIRGIFKKIKINDRTVTRVVLKRQ